MLSCAGQQSQEVLETRIVTDQHHCRCLRRELVSDREELRGRGAIEPFVMADAGRHDELGGRKIPRVCCSDCRGAHDELDGADVLAEPATHRGSIVASAFGQRAEDIGRIRWRCRLRMPEQDERASHGHLRASVRNTNRAASPPASSAIAIAAGTSRSFTSAAMTASVAVSEGRAVPAAEYNASS